MLPHRHDKHDPLCQQPPGNEGNRLRGDAIEPLRVVDEADQRLLLSAVGQQVQHRESNQETIRRFPTGQAEGGTKGATLRIGQAVKSIQERSAELMQSCVGELHLGLDAGQPHDMATDSARFEVFEQRCLADSGFASQHEHLTLPSPRASHETVEDA